MPFAQFLGWKIIEINEFYDKNERNNKNRQLTVGYLMLFRNTAYLQRMINNELVSYLSILDFRYINLDYL